MPWCRRPLFKGGGRTARIATSGAVWAQRSAPGCTPFWWIFGLERSAKRRVVKACVCVCVCVCCNVYNHHEASLKLTRSHHDIAIRFQSCLISQRPISGHLLFPYPQAAAFIYCSEGMYPHLRAAQCGNR